MSEEEKGWRLRFRKQMMEEMKEIEEKVKNKEEQLKVYRVEFSGELRADNVTLKRLGIFGCLSTYVPGINENHAISNFYIMREKLSQPLLAYILERDGIDNPEQYKNLRLVLNCDFFPTEVKVDGYNISLESCIQGETEKPADPTAFKKGMDKKYGSDEVSKDA